MLNGLELWLQIFTRESLPEEHSVGLKQMAYLDSIRGRKERKPQNVQKNPIFCPLSTFSTVFSTIFPIFW